MCLPLDARNHIGQLSSFFLGCTVLLTSCARAAEPYHPQSDGQVLQKLPRVLAVGWDELAQLRQTLAAAPHDERVAAEVASRYLQIGSQEGDPRYYGYARAALKPWWGEESPSPEVLRLRAKLKEKDHLYDQALLDLRRLVEQQPRHAQAWIELANIYRVQGRYAQARQACGSLAEFADEVQRLLCSVPIQAVTGEAEQAYATLAQVVPKAKQLWPSAVPWMRTMQAQIAWSLGDLPAAEQHFQEGLASSPTNMYLLRTYADFLLDQGRDEVVVALLREHLRDNGVLLRAAIAARRAGELELSAEWQARLENRFEEIRLRGSQPHGRFEARFELELRDQPGRSLELALANWQKQKELRDTRNVLEAALAAKDRGAVEHVLDFLKVQRTQDTTLDQLMLELEKL